MRSTRPLAQLIAKSALGTLAAFPDHDESRSQGFAAPLTSSWRQYRNTVRDRSIGQTVVVCDQSFEVIAKVERRSEVNRVERSQPRRVKPASRLEHRWRDMDQRDRIQDLTRLQHSVWHSPTNSPHQLGPNQIARDKLPIRLPQPCPERCGLRACNHQLHQR